MEATPMPAPSSSPVVRLDHATLLAAVAPGRAVAIQATRREACRLIAAQVYRVIAAVLGPASPDVGDAAQEAFLRVYKAIPGFELDPERPAGPAKWVNRIALRAALDRLKEQRKRLAQEEDIETFEPIADDDPEHAVDRKKLVTALLERLSEKERAVLVLKYWNGETDEEIAATLGLPLGTVKTRLRAASQRLRQGVRAPPVALEVLAQEGLDV
jgi:RNA polymerase sigma-70 factor, ECF subfamily